MHILIQKNYGINFLRFLNCYFVLLQLARVDVAGIFSNEWAIFARTGNLQEFSFHQVRGLVIQGTGFSDRNTSNSCTVLKL